MSIFVSQYFLITPAEEVMTIYSDARFVVERVIDRLYFIYMCYT